MSKLRKMTRFVPSLYRPDANPYVRGLLIAWSDEDDRLVQAVQNAKEQIFVKFAQLRFLDALGSNVGVFRPATINLSDDQYRELIPALSWSPKQVKPTIRKVLDVFFGQNNPLVAILELNPNEIVIQIPSSVPALRRDLRGANHFKVYTGSINSIDNVSKTMDITLQAETNTVSYNTISESNPNPKNLDSPLAPGDSSGQSFTAPTNMRLQRFSTQVSWQTIVGDLNYFTWRVLGFTAGVPDENKVLWEKNVLFTEYDEDTVAQAATVEIDKVLELQAGEQYLVSLTNNTNGLIYSGIDTFGGFVNGSAYNLLGPTWTPNSADFVFSFEGKETIVTANPSTKVLVADEWAQAEFGQGLNVVQVVGNAAGNQNVTVQFNLSADLSGFNTNDQFTVAAVPKYPGAFIPDPTQAFTVTKQRGILGQNIVAGQLVPTMVMQDASGIPDAPGRIVFNYGRSGEEADIEYFGRPNNTTLLVDPSYNFLRDHSIGEAVNVIVKPYEEPRSDGKDYAVYLVGVVAARLLAQRIVESVAASGVVVRWVVVEPTCD